MGYGEYIDNIGRVVARRNAYSNAIFITIDKLSYESSLTIELILDLKRDDARKPMYIVDAKYWYPVNDGKKSLPTSKVYNVNRIEGSSTLYIDKANPLKASPLSFDYDHS